MPRSSHVEALLGAKTFAKVRNTKILVVGAGGIGCELLKNLVLVGFANIEIVSFLPLCPEAKLMTQIDLDTIDLSNLNRQFLFRKPDISKSKALVAAATARHFNPSSGIEIHARHGNVKEATNDLEWIKGFGLVLNALDNMDARRHVNRLCQAGEVPLIESGTAGYMGQAMPIVKDKTECYDCEAKAAPKSYPVCTIRATPSEPIHCIVWAKSYLFGKLFGEDDEAVDEDELDKAKADGENAEEIENLKKEAAAFRAVRSKLGEEDGPLRVFQKVFNDDINRLLQMDDMWKVPGRVKPVALDVGAINDGSFVTPPLRNAPPVQAPAAAGSGHTASNGSNSEAGPSTPAQSSSSLRDQRELSVKDNLDLFIDSCKRLSARSIANPNVVLSFDKDDDDTLDFVVATSNLRAIAYGIPKKTRFQVKEMAGNIIPAIATTNAVVAGFIVMQAVQLLANPSSASYNKYYLRQTASLPILTYPSVEPNPDCPVCRDAYVPFKVDPTKCTLGRFVKNVVGEWLQAGLDMDGDFECTVLEGGRILADPDDEDNHGRTLADLKIGQGQMLTVMDEDEKFRPIHFCLCAPDDSSDPYTLPTQPPSIPTRPAKPAPRDPSEEDDIELVPEPTAPATAPSAQKRPAPEDEEGSVDKKQKVAKTDAVAIDDDDFEIL